MGKTAMGEVTMEAVETAVTIMVETMDMEVAVVAVEDIIAIALAMAEVNIFLNSFLIVCQTFNYLL